MLIIEISYTIHKKIQITINWYLNISFENFSVPKLLKNFFTQKLNENLGKKYLQKK